MFIGVRIAIVGILVLGDQYYFEGYFDYLSAIFDYFSAIYVFYL